MRGYNFAYLDEQTKRMIRRGLLKAVARYQTRPRLACRAIDKEQQHLALLSGCRPVISERLRLTKSSVAAYLWRAREAG